MFTVDTDNAIIRVQDSAAAALRSALEALRCALTDITRVPWRIEEIRSPVAAEYQPRLTDLQLAAVAGGASTLSPRQQQRLAQDQMVLRAESQGTAAQLDALRTRVREEMAAPWLSGAEPNLSIQWLRERLELAAQDALLAKDIADSARACRERHEREKGGAS